MTLLAPAALLLAVVALPIVLFYILRLRRQERVVSSTFLWRRAAGDVQANAPWQRLRPHLLLLLQVAAVLALVFALAHPATTESRTVTGDLVVIVDQSFGMQAHDAPGGQSRFEAALAYARTLAGQLAGGHVMSLIGMGHEPRLMVAESATPATLRAALDALQPGNDAPNFPAALSLADSLARQSGGTWVVVLTSYDSGITGPAGPLHYGLELIRFGRQARDLGIVAFRGAELSHGVQAILRVHNFGARPSSSDLDLLVNGQLADVRPLTVAPGKDLAVSWSQLPAASGPVRLDARLTVADDVAADKAAWTVVAPPPVRRVALIGPGDYFLRTALASDPSLAVLAAPTLSSALLQSVQLAVFEHSLPASLPAVPTLLVDPPAGRLGPLDFGRERAVQQVVSQPGSPIARALFRYTDLNGVQIATARQASLPASLTPLAIDATGRQPLLAVGQVSATPLAVLTFDPARSTWPLRISFPIVMHNLVRYLAPNVAPSPRGTVFPVRVAPVRGPRDVTFGQGAKSGAYRSATHVDLAWALGLLVLAVLSLEWWYGFRR